MLKALVTNLPLNIYYSVWVENMKTKRYSRNKPTFYNFVGAEFIRVLKYMLDCNDEEQGLEKGIIIQWTKEGKFISHKLTTYRDILTLVGEEKEFLVRVYRKLAWNKKESIQEEGIKLSYKEAQKNLKMAKKAMNSYQTKEQSNNINEEDQNYDAIHENDVGYYVGGSYIRKRNIKRYSDKTSVQKRNRY